MTFWIFAVALVWALTSRASAAETGTTNGVVPAPNAEVEQAIKLSGNYLERACNNSGRFAYEVYVSTGEISHDYEITRHTGAIYALAMLNAFQSDDDAVAAMTRAGGFTRRYLDSVFNETGTQKKLLAIWLSPVRNTASQASLGATGLGLHAFTELRRVDPKSSSDEELEAMAQFLVSLQKDDGSFFGTYYFDTGPGKPLDPLYAPAESVLGLTSLYELDHSTNWLTPAARGLAWLAKSRLATPDQQVDQWILIATAKFLPYYDASHCPVSREVMLDAARQMCDKILAEQINRSPNPEFLGGFDKSGNTTPTATRLEGLLAAMEFIPHDQADLRARMERAIRRGIDFLLRAQVKSGRFAGGVPGMVSTTASGGHVVGDETDTVRIDYVQHALCAWIRYEKFLQNQSR